jgi:APA family basic amino acid/polyamine antiporter
MAAYHGFHFGCNSLILSEGLFFFMAKDGLFFKQATELNKNQVPAKRFGCSVFGRVLCISGFRDLLTYATFASLFLYPTILGYLFLEEPNADTQSYPFYLHFIL